MIKTKLERLKNAFAEGSLDIDEFKELKNPLGPRKVELEEKILAVEKNNHDRLEPLRSWISEANNAAHWAAKDNWSEMKSFLQRVRSSRLLRAQTLTVCWKSPWGNLAETTRAMRVAGDFLEVNSVIVEPTGLEPYNHSSHSEGVRCPYADEVPNRPSSRNLAIPSILVRRG